MKKNMNKGALLKSKKEGSRSNYSQFERNWRKFVENTTDKDDWTESGEELIENNIELLEDNINVVKGNLELMKKSAIYYEKALTKKITTLIPKTKKTLVLDLDETLIHSSFEPTSDYSLKLPIVQEGIEKNIYINKRPFLDEFIAKMSNYYELMIFTAGLENYANLVIDNIDKNRLIKKRFYRSSCIYYNGYYIKNLEIVNKSLKDVIIIDNSPSCYCLNLNNAIPIKSFFDDQDDLELFYLIPLLTYLAQVEDVTSILSKLYRLDSYLPLSIVNEIKQHC